MLFTLVLLLPLLPTQVVGVDADRDNTLIEDSSGSLSNGAGPAFFVGRTNQPQDSIRRGVLRFDLEGVLPKDAVVVGVKLILNASATNGLNTVHLYRLRQDWGEGSSSSVGGQGAPAESGDATWLHTLYDQEFWCEPGGDRARKVSARASVAAPGLVELESERLESDVVAWLHSPRENFGWILIGDETSPQTVTRFDSRESPDPLTRPVLEITYRVGSRR